MNELEKNVLQLIGENIDDPDVFTDDSSGMAQIRESLNDAIEEVCLVTGSVKRTYKMPLRENAHFYRMNFTRDRLAWVTDVWLYGTTKRLEQVDFVQLEADNPRWLYNTGTPERYCQIGEDIICVHPASSSNSDFFEITGVVIPARYDEDTDRIHLRRSYKWAAVKFAVSEYFAGRGDAKTATTWYYEYLAELGMQNLYPDLGDKDYELGTNKNSD